MKIRLWKLFQHGELLMRRVVMRRSARHDLHGLTVVMHRAGRDHMDACVAKVRVALDLLDEYDPEKLEEMRARFDYVLIWPYLAASNGAYLHSERACELNCEYVEKESTAPARVAMTLVHEVTHARQFARHNPKRPMSRPQAEWLCIGAEIAFAGKVPGTEHLIAAARRRMERRPEFYSRRADAERALAELRKGGVAPRWLLRLMKRMYERRYGTSPAGSTPEMPS